MASLVGTTADELFFVKAYGRDTIADPSATDSDTAKTSFDYVLDTNVENLALWGDNRMMEFNFGGGEMVTFARVMDPSSAIVGSWTLGSGEVNDLVVMTFLQDGTYLLTDDGNHTLDPSGRDGIERGTYKWNPVTSAFTFKTTYDGDDEWGLSHSGANQFVIHGGTATLQSSTEGGTTLTRVSGAGLVGSYYMHEGTGVSVITFLDGHKYAHVQKGPNTSLTGRDGFELGTYTWDPSTGAFTSVATIDRNGDWGLADATGSAHGTTGAVVSTRGPNGTGNAQANTLTGDNTSNILSGLDGNDVLKGKGSNDKLLGGSGNDQLYGGTSKDVLNGGGGADKFYFDTATGSTNIDTIQDFVSGVDQIVLDDDIFSALGITGTAAGANLTLGKFWVGTAAHDTSDRIIYDSGTGRLYYDADGNGDESQQVLIATLAGDPALAVTDFKIVA
jgi:Ca2+-binding RTX toxin-like protein